MTKEAISLYLSSDYIVDILYFRLRIKVRKIKNFITNQKLITQFQQEDKYNYLLLLSAPFLLSVYRYFVEAQDFQDYFPAIRSNSNGDVYAYLLEYLSFAVLFFVIPLIIAIKNNKAKQLLRLFNLESIKTYVLWITGSVLLIVIPVAFIVSHNSTVLLEYPLPQSLNQNQQLLPVYFISLLFFYYLPWEFFFRGFLLFGLKDRYGATEAILIQTISSCLVHINKPAGETLGAIPFGILFGIIALKTKSLWPVIILHAALGIFTDLFIIY